MVDAIKFVSAKAIEGVLRYSELIPTVEQALAKFSNRANSGVIQPVRTVLRVPAVDGMFITMPACSPGDEVMSAKLVTFFPKNTQHPTHHALIVLFCPNTGVPRAILDGDVITAKRTAAVSAVATKHLMSGPPSHLAILGAGVQAQSHYHALTSLFTFDKVTLWNHRPEKAVAVAGQLGGGVVAVEGVREAVEGADVIVTVTNSATPILKKEWVKPGAHINAVGSCRPDWQELDSDLMTSSAVYVESTESASTESGDIILSGASITAELGDVILGKVEAKKAQTTVFKSLGIAIEDAVSAGLVLKMLEEQDKAQ